MPTLLVFISPTTKPSLTRSYPLLLTKVSTTPMVPWAPPMSCKTVRPAWSSRARSAPETSCHTTIEASSHLMKNNQPQQSTSFKEIRNTEELLSYTRVVFRLLSRCLTMTRVSPLCPLVKPCTKTIWTAKNHLMSSLIPRWSIETWLPAWRPQMACLRNKQVPLKANPRDLGWRTSKSHSCRQSQPNSWNNQMERRCEDARFFWKISKTSE